MKKFEKFKKFETDGSQVTGGYRCPSSQCDKFCQGIDNEDVRANCYRFCWDTIVKKSIQ